MPPAWSFFLTRPYIGKCSPSNTSHKEEERASSDSSQSAFMRTMASGIVQAYCFLRQGFRVFRCDRIREAAYDVSGTEPLDLGDVQLSQRENDEPREPIRLRAELSRAGVQRCEAELWLASCWMCAKTEAA